MRLSYITMLSMIKIKLRELMWDADVTAVEIERTAGVGANTISRIIHGRNTNITLETVEKLCRFFNCKLTDLLELVD